MTTAIATETIPIAQVRYVKEMYPRLRPSDEVIDRYRAAVDRLPPIVVARDGVLVDGYHRWKAHEREGATEIAVENVGDLTDHEIITESVRRNATHGQQLSIKDKRDVIERLWPAFAASGKARIGELAELFAVSRDAIELWTKGVRAAEQKAKHERAYDLWLDCWTQDAIATEMGVDQKTVTNWLRNLPKDRKTPEAPESRQHFDVWDFPNDGGDGSYFGRLPVGVVENLLWLYTDPGQIVVDLFAGSGTIIETGKAMGRRVWASDRASANDYPYLPIHTHDVADGWPAGAPRADLIVLDPPYWRQAENRYSTDDADLGNMPYPAFLQAWADTIKTCSGHLTKGGRIAYIIGPTQTDDQVVDHATDMLRAAWDAGLTIERRIIVCYSTQQATGQQVTWARDSKLLLKRYRDLVVLRP